MKRVSVNPHFVELEKGVLFILFRGEISIGRWLPAANNVTYKKGGIYEHVYN